MNKIGLQGAQIERLAWLMEELGETIQAIGKILRHGYESKDPDNPTHKGNKDDLEREMADVYAALTLLSNHGDINLMNVMSYSMTKSRSKYFHYEENRQ